MASVSVKGVTKKFGRYVALSDVTLDVRDQEFVVLLGPSGCGKTTLLNMIAGLVDPDHGSVWINGERVDGLSPGERDIGFVFQSYALYPSKTVRENLAFALKFRGVPSDGGSRRKFIDNRVRTVADMLHIDSLLDRYPGELSGGQKQRVAMGRALVRQPRAFLFDEPLSNLDAILRVSVRQEIRDLHEKLRATMIYVTHDQTEAMSLGQRVVVMKDGRVLEVGTPENVYNRPEWLFTARFVGTPPMNLVEGQLIDEEGRVGLRTSGGILALPELIAARYRFALRRSVTFGIRPEDIDFVDRFPSSSKASARVIGREFQGSMCLVHVDAVGGRLVVASNRIVGGGEQVNLFFDMKKFHLFDSTTERVIRAEA